MKNFVSLLVIVCAFSASCFAQQDDLIVANERMGIAQLMSDQMSNNDLVVVAYHVEETINMPLGGSITTYEVSNISLVGTNDLGQNNTRIVTPKYGKAKPKVFSVNHDITLTAVGVVATSVKPFKPILRIPREKVKFVNIDIFSTYERVLDKGYKSIDMLKKVANNRYFEGELQLAAKWYSQLFELTADLEPEYYFRYSKALASVGQNEKANEMMAIFEKRQ